MDEEPVVGWLGSISWSAKEITSVVSAILAVIAAALSIFYGWQNYQSKKEATALENSLRQVTAAANEKEQELTDKLNQVHSAIEQSQEDRQRVMTVYNEVIAAIHDTASNRKGLAAQLVVFYLKSAATKAAGPPSAEDLFRDKMLDMLGAHATKDEVAVVEQAKSDLQDQVPTLGQVVAASNNTPAALSKDDSLQGYRVDVFWCEGSGDRAQDGALKLSSLLSTRTSGMVRVREFPDALRQNSYQHIASAEIRRELPSEAGVGNKLLSLSVGSLISSGIVRSQSEVNFVQVRTPTPGYVSLFICP